MRKITRAWPGHSRTCPCGLRVRDEPGLVGFLHPAHPLMRMSLRVRPAVGRVAGGRRGQPPKALDTLGRILVRLVPPVKETAAEACLLSHARTTACCADRPAPGQPPQRATGGWSDATRRRGFTLRAPQAPTRSEPAACPACGTRTHPCPQASDAAARHPADLLRRDRRRAPHLAPRVPSYAA